LRSIAKLLDGPRRTLVKIQYDRTQDFCYPILNEITTRYHFDFTGLNPILALFGLRKNILIGYWHLSRPNCLSLNIPRIACAADVKMIRNCPRNKPRFFNMFNPMRDHCDILKGIFVKFNGLISPQ